MKKINEELIKLSNKENKIPGNTGFEKQEINKFDGSQNKKKYKLNIIWILLFITIGFFSILYFSDQNEQQQIENASCTSNLDNKKKLRKITRNNGDSICSGSHIIYNNLNRSDSIKAEKTNFEKENKVTVLKNKNKK